MSKRDYSKPLPGDFFGRLVVESTYLHRTATYSKTFVVCRCVCGNQKEVKASLNSLRKGNTQSCGCLQRERASEANKIHGATVGRGQRLYRLWSSIKRRCYNPNAKEYKNYGARGIVVDPCWVDSYESFATWAMSNGFKARLEIDRIDNDGPYSPDNCRFVTHQQNQRNKRTSRVLEVDGCSLTVAGWADRLGVNAGVLYMRLNRGWSDSDVVGTPVISKENEHSLGTVYEAFGESKTMREWLDDSRCAVKYNTLRNRLRRGWGTQEALTTIKLKRD